MKLIHEARQFKRAGESECIGAGFSPAEESKLWRTRIDKCIVNRPGVAGDVLQSPPSLTD